MRLRKFSKATFMPRPSQRSRSLRRMKRKTPGGRRVLSYERRKGKQARCSVCKKPLPGVPRGTNTQIKGLAKTRKRPERPFGGFLCSSCARKEMKKRLMETKW